MHKSSTRVYTLAEAVEHPLLAPYGVTVSALRRAAQTGRLSYTRIGGGRSPITLTGQDIAQFVARSRVEVEALPEERA